MEPHEHHETQQNTTNRTLPAIGWETAGLRMSPEEFDAIEDYDELYRYELVNGVLVVNPIPLEGQSSPNEFLGGLLFVYRHQHPNGAVIDETLQERYIHLPNSRRQPDRVIWAGLGSIAGSASGCADHCRGVRLRGETELDSRL